MGKIFLLTDNQQLIIEKCREMFANLRLDGMKKEEFSEKFGISYSNCRRYANGELDIPLALLLHVAEVTHTDLAPVFSHAQPTNIDSSRVLLETIDNLNRAIAAKEAEIAALKGAAVNYTNQYATAATSAENQPKI